MKKYMIDVFEEVSYNHSVIFETDAADIDKILDKLEDEESLDDMILSLKNQGCNIEEVYRDDGGLENIEIENCMRITKEEEKA